MTTDDIHEAFTLLLQERGVHKKLGVSSSAIRSLRWRLASGEPVSTEKKLQLLQKSGWTQDDKEFNRKDLVNLLGFYDRLSSEAKKLGPEYCVEKFMHSRK